MDCCSGDQKDVKKEDINIGEKEPKSFIGKFLYKLGKEDLEKNKKPEEKPCH